MNEGIGMEGISPSLATRRSGKRRELLSGVRGGNPAENEFGSF